MNKIDSEYVLQGVEGFFQGWIRANLRVILEQKKVH
jgi:hypothetical protein